jgi:hypothetical protein
MKPFCARKPGPLYSTYSATESGEELKLKFNVMNFIFCHLSSF